jgi:hypothetical protein
LKQGKQQRQTEKVDIERNIETRKTPKIKRASKYREKQTNKITNKDRKRK